MSPTSYRAAPPRNLIVTRHSGQGQTYERHCECSSIQVAGSLSSSRFPVLELLNAVVPEEYGSREYRLPESPSIRKMSDDMIALFPGLPALTATPARWLFRRNFCSLVGCVRRGPRSCAARNPVLHHCYSVSRYDCSGRSADKAAAEYAIRMDGRQFGSQCTQHPLRAAGSGRSFRSTETLTSAPNRGHRTSSRCATIGIRKSQA
jgi:hypothetical protein